MESGPYHNKDDPSTSVPIPNIPADSKLTEVDGKQDVDIKIKQNDYSAKFFRHLTSYDIQNERTNSYNQSRKDSSYDNQAFVPSDPVKKHHNNNEYDIYHENQHHKSPVDSNKENVSNLRCESILPVEHYYNNENYGDHENKYNISLSPHHLEDHNKGKNSYQFDLCQNTSDHNIQISEQDFSLSENSDAKTYENLQNNRSRRISSVSFCEIPNNLEEISAQSSKGGNPNDLNIDDARSQKSSVSSEYNPLAKFVSIVTQESQEGSILALQGNNRSPIRRMSKRRLSQWGKRKHSFPKGKTYVRIVEGVNEKRLWSDARSLHKPALFVLWWSTLAMITYIASFYDLWSDSSVAHLFYNQKEYKWCIVSVFLLVTSYFIQCCFSFYEVIHGGRKNFGRLSKKRYSIPLFILLPWIIVFIGVYDTYKNKYTWRLETAYIMMFIEVIFESLPQACLQLNAIIVYEHDPDKPHVSVLQWCSVSSSILFLSMGIAYSVIFYNNTNATQKIKLFFCIFGGITVVSRILLCCSWSLRTNISRYLWFLPFSTGLITTSMTWLVLRTFPWFGYKEYLTKYDINSLPMAFVTASSFLTSFIFNCFSPSGIPVSVLMYSLAMVDFHLGLNDSQTSDYTLHVVNICLTIFVLLCNIVFAYVPKCHILSQVWIEGEGDDEDDPYHFRFY